MMRIVNGKEIRGRCEVCESWYECREDPQSGGGLCGYHYRSEAGLFNPVTSAVTFWGCVAADNLRHTKTLQPKKAVQIP